MKMLLLSVPLVFGMLFVQAQNGNLVNAVLGDKSFIALFQQLPDKNTMKRCVCKPTSVL
jgi:hypothetical protein